MNIAVVGAGGWGTTLAILLHKKGNRVSILEHFPDYAKFLDKKRENVKFLPNMSIPKGIIITSDFKEALDKVELIVLAVPSQFLEIQLKKLMR